MNRKSFALKLLNQNRRKITRARKKNKVKMLIDTLVVTLTFSLCKRKEEKTNNKSTKSTKNNSQIKL